MRSDPPLTPAYMAESTARAKADQQRERAEVLKMKGLEDYEFLADGQLVKKKRPVNGVKPSTGVDLHLVAHGRR